MTKINIKIDVLKHFNYFFSYDYIGREVRISIVSVLRTLSQSPPLLASGHTNLLWGRGIFPIGLFQTLSRIYPTVPSDVAYLARVRGTMHLIAPPPPFANHIISPVIFCFADQMAPLCELRPGRDLPYSLRHLQNTNIFFIIGSNSHFRALYLLISRKSSRI